MLIRLLDFFFSLFGLLFGFPVLLALVVIGFFDTGSPVFRQERVGRNKKPFTLVKFRTMKKRHRLCRQPPGQCQRYYAFWALSSPHQAG